MSLRDIWKTAVEYIAGANDQSVIQAVDAERVRLESADDVNGFSASVENAVRCRHSFADILKLRDFVCYLIWAKLSRDWDGRSSDPFLGLSDLEAYLSASVPSTYSQADVTDFLATLGPPTKLGDLRSFLCARPGSKESGQLYTHDELDLSLLAEEIEIVRYTPPDNLDLFG